MLYVASIVGILIVLILGGAPLNHGYQRTSSLALLLSAYTTLPIVIQFGNLNEDIIRDNKRTLSLIAIGAWIAIIPIGLDWERPWQVYPLTIAVGSTIGYATARMTDVVSRS